MQSENHKDLCRYLVKEDNVYASIIEPYIDDILSKRDEILEIFKNGGKDW